MSFRLQNLGVSVSAFCVAVRWASRNGFPKNMDDFTQEHADKLALVAKESDRRTDERWARRQGPSGMSLEELLADDDSVTFGKY